LAVGKQQLKWLPDECVSNTYDGAPCARSQANAQPQASPCGWVTESGRSSSSRSVFQLACDIVRSVARFRRTWRVPLLKTNFVRIFSINFAMLSARPELSSLFSFVVVTCVFFVVWNSQGLMVRSYTRWT